MLLYPAHVRLPFCVVAMIYAVKKGLEQTY
jgi:hypothetical protein